MAADVLRIPCDEPPPSDLARARALDVLEASTAARVDALADGDPTLDLSADLDDLEPAAGDEVPA